ncbi:MAG: terminase small subunit [Eubacteriales bacterium]|nr:terminase small subunit [Eubacteriales bacterium]
MPELKNKQRERFCLEYASGQNGTQAAIAAGYSEKTAGSKANQLLKIVEVKDRINELMTQFESEKVADAQEVMEYLTSVMRGESRSSVLCFAGEGVQRIIEKPPDEREKLKAAEMIGKRYGLYTDKIDLDADAELHITVDYGGDDGGNNDPS